MITQEFTKREGGVLCQWRLKNSNGDDLSIVLIEDDNGKFETMCSWLDDVQRYLTFAQVQSKINTLKWRDIRV